MITTRAVFHNSCNSSDLQQENNHLSRKSKEVGSGNYGEGSEGLERRTSPGGSLVSSASIKTCDPGEGVKVCTGGKMDQFQDKPEPSAKAHLVIDRVNLTANTAAKRRGVLLGIHRQPRRRPPWLPVPKQIPARTHARIRVTSLPDKCNQSGPEPLRILGGFPQFL